MIYDQAKLKQSLLNTGLITEAQYRNAVIVAQDEKKPLQQVLVELELINDEQLGQLIAQLAGFSFVNLRRESIDPKTLRMVPEVMARKQKIISFKLEGDKLHLAMNNPNDFETIKLVEKKTAKRVVPFFATIIDLRSAYNKYKGEVVQEFQDVIAEVLPQVKGFTSADTDLEKQARKIPVIKMFNSLVEYAFNSRASDIHIQPEENSVRIRFRVDGVLQDIIEIPKVLQNFLVARVKILSNLRTDEHFKPQDGRFKMKISDDEELNLRVSVVPTYNGEKVVTRLLAEKVRRYSLEELGFNNKDMIIVKRNFAQPYGMILVTGPTGCGKTTTLYAILKMLNTPGVNISTIEDPVEYDISGVNQIQVNPKVDLTFAGGLRALVRQDPDIIMVGEIRDEETAGIAVNSAMTGHLVLSTIHTDTAATTLPRMMDMEVEPYLIASTINVIITQRLVRNICSKCIESYTITGQQAQDLLKNLNVSPEFVDKLVSLKKKSIRLYKGKGCPFCNNTGYYGRSGVFEIMEMQPNIQELIVQKATSDKLEGAAIANGMTTMLEDGIRKALLGQTTFEEALRVVREK